MFGLTKKIFIVTCMVAFYPGQFCAFGSVSDSYLDCAGAGQHRRQPTNSIETTIPIESPPSAIMCEIFQFAASQGTDPCDLRLVCKRWRNVLDVSSQEDNKGAGEDDKGPGSSVMVMSVMETCMKLYRSSVDLDRFLKGVLQYKLNTDNDEGMVTLKISDFKNGTFDLSECGGTAENLVITTNLSEFFAEHEDKVVIGFFLRYLVKKQIDTTASHFKPIMEKWDRDKAPVSIFLRWGSWNDLTWYDYITQSTFELTIPGVEARIFLNSTGLAPSPGAGVAGEYEYNVCRLRMRNIFDNYSKKFHVCF